MQLWREEAGGRWGRIPIVHSVRIGDGDAVVAEEATNARALIIPYQEHGRARAVLICGLGAGLSLTINGYPPLGVTVLEDRDEIVIRGEPGHSCRRLVFTEREPARVFQFSESMVSPGEGRCARCRKPLRSGDAVVRCPACQRWSHEGLLASGKRRECWSYDPVCGGCRTSRAAMSWSPEAGEACEPEIGSAAVVEVGGDDVGSGNAPGPASTGVAA